MRRLQLTAIALLAAVLVPAAASAQLVKITPKIGGHFSSSSISSIRDDAGQAFDFEEASVSSFAFGANVELGAPGLPLGLRGDVVLSTGNEATLDASELESTLVGASGSLVFRPLSVLPLVDPYLLGGAGFTSTNYDASGFEGDLPTDREFALHTGLGTDISLGGTRLQIEATDYITGVDTDFDVQHDVFVTAGLGFSFT